MVNPAVLPLLPLLLDKVWGGDRLRDFGLAVPTGARVGEAWLVADLESTSTSGAGGGAMRSPLRDNPARTLSDAVRANPAHWLGPAAARTDGGFPLLVKLLDAREHLSVQVHPAPRVATATERVKHECWHVLAAEPGSRLFLGLADGCDLETLRDAIRTERVAEVLRAVPAVAGECHFLPSGLVHALGAGVVVAEVQTPSDTTYRLYDWTTEYRRAPRQMHVQQALAAADPALAAITRAVDDTAGCLLASTKAFKVFHLPVSAASQKLDFLESRWPAVLVPLRGTVMSGGAAQLQLEPGESAVVAAGACAGLQLQSAGTAAELLVVEVHGELA